MRRLRLIWPALVIVILPVRLLAVLGVGDTSFVTILANPAEAANWAAQIRNLEAQLVALRSTLEEVEAARAMAGDPGLAARSATGLPALLSADAALLRQASSVAAIGGQATPSATDPALASLVAYLAGGGNAPGTMSVQGQTMQRDLSRYLSSAAEVNTAQAVQGQLAQEQAGRVGSAGELGVAWSDFQSATTESQKQAALTRITALEAADHLAANRRMAMAEDLALADRAEHGNQRIAATAADEQASADAAALLAKNVARRQAAEAGRLAVLAEVPDAPAVRDYSGLQLWTPAGSGSP